MLGVWPTVKWYRRAAEQGNVLAQTNLGIMYAEGHGVAKNYAEAAKWYRLAAGKGSADAQYNLAVEYAKDRSVQEQFFAETKKIVVNELGTCWRKFSEQELSAMKGKDELVSRVQLKYGFSKEQALRDVDARLRGRPF
jgi:TPR repeat protein